jgi:hypothetical protein
VTSTRKEVTHEQRPIGLREEGEGMRTFRIVLGVVLALGMMLAFGSPVTAGGRPLSTVLTGGAERPGPGDPDASGTAFVTLNQGQGEVCYTLTWQDIDGTVSRAHIHQAPVGAPGPIVVAFFEAQAFPGTGSDSNCVTNVDPELIKDIRQHPDAYYVNIHSTPNFPAGAVRGQLDK